MAEKSPTVSIIIPTYNRAHLLGRSIQSVLDQTYQDFEIIIVDDGSTDNTEEVVRSFPKEILYLRHEKNKGAAAARNTGIKAAKGKYLAFQDSDDKWLPEKLGKQIKVFETTPANVGVVYTSFQRLKGNESSYVPFSWVSKKEGNIYEQLLIGNFVGTPTMLIRAECLEKCGVFDEKLPALEDWELSIRLAEYYNFKLIDEVLHIAYNSPDSISENKIAYIEALKIIFDNYFDDIRKNKKLLARHCFLIGSILCNIENYDIGKHYLIKAFKAHPLNIKYLLHTFLSFFGQSNYNKLISRYRIIRAKIVIT